MATPILQIDTLTKSFGDLLLFQESSFGIAEGEKVGLIARNGAGKTTLLNILSGKEPYDDGRVVFRNNTRVAYLEQSPLFDPDLTVLEACFSSDSEVVKLIARYEEVIASGDQSKLDEVLVQMDLHNAWDYEQRVKQVLTRLNITDFQQKMGELSGGQAKRVALANVLISEPNLLIMDEPTNHLDLEMVEWLEGQLARSPVALLMVTHDRYFLDRVCTRILEIDDQQIYGYKGNYSYYLEKREERVTTQQAEVDRAKNLMRKELEWMRRQPQARGTKSKSRVDAFYTLEEKAREKTAEQSVRFAAKGAYIGKKIFGAKNVSKRYDDIRITDSFNYTFTRYEKMGIVGNNGTGKSTFVKMLLGEVEPDSGYFEIGETVNFGYYSQDGIAFNEQIKVLDAVQNIAEVIDLGDGHRLTASQFLQHFLFPPEKQHDYVYKLSGGEKRRLYLCTVLIKNPNFLVLDEPTNDLDILTLNVLEEYLAGFKGCLIVISHDRYFMDKVVDHLLVFHGDAKIQNFPGNYSLYRAWKAEEEKRELAEAKIAEAKATRVGRDTGEVSKTDDSASRGRRKKEEEKKLTFKERQEYESLEVEIEQMEAEKEAISEQLSSGTLPTEELMSQSERLSALMEQIDEKTMRWLELSERA
ncbi:MAG: ABC-F family ATP-binding cassette domain-containing protein [Bacteroidales bacterium]|nr:ABC-F family ATP-binding cassette domain-containing protein [Bacteroidales bacterium]